MGKSKPRNRAKNRNNPTAREVKPPTDPELAALRQQSILPVLKDLQSADVKARSTAARAITNLIEDNKTRKLLLREQIVKILLEQTLTDSSLETRIDGWGILQNLVLEEDRDFCVHLFRRDILTAIEGAGKSILEILNSKDAPFKRLSRSQQELVWTLTSSLISLISSLSEAQDEINQAISNRLTISHFLIEVISKGEVPDYIQLEGLSCMALLLEDNEALAQQVVKHEELFLEYLILSKEYTDIKNYTDIQGVGACQVLHNLFASLKWYDHNTPMLGASDACLIPTLVHAMDQTKKQTNASTNGVSKHSSPDQTIQLALEITAAIATGLQEALEHAGRPGNVRNVRNEEEFAGFDDTDLTNGHTEPMQADGEDGAEEEDEGDEMDVEPPENENGEMDEDEIAADMELVTGDGPDDDSSASGTATLDRLVQMAVPKIINLFHQDNGNTSHALSALNNIAWAVSVIDFSDEVLKKNEHLKNTYYLWDLLAQQIWNEIVSPFLASNIAEVELASITTSIAWAVSRCVKGGIKIQPGEPQRFMALYQEYKAITGGREEGKANDGDDDPFQSLGVKCIGALGSLALHPAPIDRNREISVFLLTVLSGLPNTPPAAAVEALNQIFDIYADKEYAFDEPVFWHGNYPKHLEGMQPKVKKLAKSIDKRDFPELRERVDEALLNLHRFLTFKRKEKRDDNLIDLDYRMKG